LQESLKPHVPESLLDRLKTAIDLRNEVAHSFQSEITDTETYKLLGLPVDAIQSGERITVKRNPKKGAAPFNTLIWTGDGLKKLHKELNSIEADLEKILRKKINALLELSVHVVTNGSPLVTSQLQFVPAINRDTLVGGVSVIKT